MVFDPADSEYRLDPYPTFARLRDEHPIFWSDAMNAWVVSRHADVVNVLRDSTWLVRPAAGFQDRQYESGDGSVVADLMSQFYNFLDPPTHSRLRNMVVRTFTPRAVEAMRERIVEVVDDLLDKAVEKGHIELMGDLSYPLTAMIVTEMIGVEPEDSAFFLEWSKHLAGLIEWDAKPERMMKGVEAMLTLAMYFNNLIEKRRETPKADLVTAWLATEEDGKLADHAELLAMCALLLTVGYETTMNSLGNGALALLNHQDELERLRRTPEVVGTAVDELLRYDAPVLMTGRLATVDMEVVGQVVRKDEMIVTMLGAANRDERHFPDADRLDLGREDNRHMTFGHGGHFCLGAALARLEGQVVFSTLANRFASIEAMEPPDWRDTSTLRALNRLPIAFT